jgi:DNA-directed RNA polymerase subunit omega
MIEALKNDNIIRKMGGRFKLTALIQHRWVELIQGARPMVNPDGKTEMEIVVEEILQNKIEIDWEKSNITPPEAAS